MSAGRQAEGCAPAVRLIVWASRFFRGRPLPGRSSPELYFEMQWNHARRALLPYLEAHASLSGRRILDVGCGRGGATALYGSAGPALTVGIDRDVDLLPKKGDKAWDAVRFAGADVTRLPFANGAFDLAILDNAFEHLPDPEASLGEIRRVLKPGGRVVLNFPSWRAPWGHHIYDFIPIPWVHLVFAQETLVRAIDRTAERRTRAGEDPGYVEYWRDRTVRQFVTGLNRMTVRRLESVVRRTGPWRTRDMAVRYESRWAKPLGFWPGLAEFFTRGFDLVLERTDESGEAMRTGKAFRGPFLNVLRGRIGGRQNG